MSTPAPAPTPEVANTAATTFQDIGVPILIIVAIGFIFTITKIFDRSSLWYLNKLVFFLGIPCLIFKLLATTNFGSLNWAFVRVFLWVRIFSAIINFGAAFLFFYFRGKPVFQSRHSFGTFLGEFLTNYIATTWINTVIFGLPIIINLYGPKYGLLTVLASLSSLFMQLPVMLALFEIRKVLMGGGKSQETVEISPKARDGDGNEIELQYSEDAKKGDDANGKTAVVVIQHQPSNSNLNGDGHNKVENLNWVAQLKIISMRVVMGVISNPPMIGIIAGMIYTGSWTDNCDGVGGPKCVPYLPSWLGNTVTWLSNIVDPIAAFVVGMFMATNLQDLRQNWLPNVVFLFGKFVLLPLLTIGCIHIEKDGVQGIDARVAVIISAMPVAVSAFPLCRTYGVGYNIQSTQVVAGTILMLPFVVIWETILQDHAHSLLPFPST